MTEKVAQAPDDLRIRQWRTSQRAVEIIHTRDLTQADEPRVHAAAHAYVRVLAGMDALPNLENYRKENEALCDRIDELELFEAESEQAFKDLDLKIEFLTEDADRLANALRPFVAYLEAADPKGLWTDDSEIGSAIGRDGIRYGIRYAHLRAARAALNEYGGLSGRPLGADEAASAEGLG